MDNRTFSLLGVSYKVSDLTEDQLRLVKAYLDGEQKIAELQSELTLLQAGKSSILETLKTISATLTPVAQES